MKMPEVSDDRVGYGLESNRIVIGWPMPNLIDVANRAEDQRSLRRAIEEQTGLDTDKAKQPAGNLWRFLREMQPTDLVLVPRAKDGVYLARVIGGPSIDERIADWAGAFRCVDWLNGKRPFDRGHLRPEVKGATENQHTCLNAKHLLPQIKDMAAGRMSAAREIVGPLHQCSINTILYGPPGTGKTYITARRCVEICDKLTDAEADEEKIRERYRQLVKEKRVEFVTFHESYGYEEFVEGLRPAPNKDGQAGFRLKPKAGVLKRIARRARKNPEHA